MLCNIIRRSFITIEDPGLVHFHESGLVNRVKGQAYYAVCKTSLLQ